MHLVIVILFFYNFLCNNIYLYHYIFWSIHLIVHVKSFDVHAQVSQFDVKDGAVDMQFHCVKVWCGCFEFPWIVYKISYWSYSCSRSIWCLGYDVTKCSHIGFSYVFWFLFVKDKLYCVGSCMFFASLIQVAKFVEHWVCPYWFIHFYWVSESQ